MKTNIEEIQKYAENYGEKARLLKAKIDEMEKDLTAIRKSHLPELVVLAAEAADAQKLTELAIMENRELFQKKKTFNVNGVKFGINKQRDRFETANELSTIQAIKEFLAEKAPMLLNIKESIMKSAMDKLTTRELKQIGVTVVPGDETPIVRLMDDALEKYIIALQKEQLILN